jgi:antirestriction protein ArdC
MTHWTGNASRLARDFSGRFGDEAYAFEELVAELGAAMLCAQLGISVEPRADHAQYLNNWLKVLRGDNKAILKAATLAKQAAAYLSKTSEEEDTGEEETAQAA